MSRWGTAPPWSRAPFMMWKQPAVALAVAVAAFLVALPAAAASLFLSSAGNATLRQEVDSTCQWNVGAQWAGSFPYTREVPVTALDENIRAAKSATAGVPGLSEPVVTLVGGAELGGTGVWLVARDGFADHVQVLAGGTGRGVWLPDGLAAARNLRVGESVPVYSGAQPVTMPVAAIYRDLRSLPDQPFWCSLRDRYRGKPLGETPVYPFALVSRDDFLLAKQGNLARADNYIERTVDSPDLTTASALVTVAGLDQARQHSVATLTYTSELGKFVDRANEVRGALVGTVVPLAAAGTLAGLVIAASAGAFWVDRRRGELAVLAARGVGPTALAGKAALEVLPVVVAGAVGGWFAARALVGAVGPSPLVTPGAFGVSVAGAGLAFLATLAAIAGVGGVRAGRIFDARPVRSNRLRYPPWELVPLVAAVLCWFFLSGEVRTSFVARIPPRMIVVPILAVIGLAMLAGRIVRLVLARAPSSSMRRPALFLAWRRIVSAPAAAALMVGATAVPVALSGFGATVTGSVDRTLHAEGRLIVGSDLALDLTEPAPVPPALAGQATVVDVFDSGHVGGTTVNVLGVDPQTFARGAFWDPGLPGPSLAELMSRLDSSTGVLAGIDGQGPLDIDGHTLPLTIVNVPQLPGKKPGYPLLMVRRDVLEGATSRVHQQMWVRGEPAKTIPAAAGLPVGTVSEAASVTARGVYAAITYTFTFLAAISLLAGAIIVVGLLLYLTARARSRRSAYVLLRRMGVGAGAHWLALLTEVGGLLLTGFAVGLGLAAVVVALTYPGYDVDPGTPPVTVLDPPWPLLGGLAAATAVTTVIAAFVAQRAVSRAHPVEVLRDAR